MRAAEPSELDQLESQCRDLVSASQADGVEVTISEIGRRPAGSIDVQHPLVRIARAASERHGIANEIVASSTDANAAHPRGVSAVALGVDVRGRRAHR